MRIEIDIPEAVLHGFLDAVPVPPFAPVQHRFNTPEPVADIAGTVARELNRSDVRALFRAGERIAVGVGSRGIHELPAITAATVAALRQWGCEPFVVPTMGSHGGATAEGQREVLEHLGVTPETVGAPVVSSMETVVVGQTADGMPVHCDRNAFDADGILLIGRIKPHTAFRGRYESGLAKMIAIGLGKQAGAAATHARGFGEMARMVPQMAEVALQRASIRVCLGVLENAYDRVFRIAALPADRVLAEEPALLDAAREAMPRLPCDDIDVLVIDRIGKNISGDGADPNITGRYPTPFASGGPTVAKQVVLDLADASLGNANGVGSADFTTVRLIQKMKPAATYPNALTSTIPRPVGIPMMLPSDRLALQAAILTCNAVGRAPRIVRIVDTLHLEYVWISDSLLTEVARNTALAVLGNATALPFDERGDLLDLGRDPSQIQSIPVPPR